jgi:Asp-tRNA(Asn)/Glu-tRNA(Gln) amidotransferase C subunit
MGFTIMERDELMVTARLALLEVSGEEMARLEAEVLRMLDYFSRMKDLEPQDGPGGEPPGDPTGGYRLREDALRAALPAAEAAAGTQPLLENAPEREERFISIPNVL